MISFATGAFGSIGTLAGHLSSTLAGHLSSTFSTPADDLLVAVQR
jgi:hypothetical protein